MALSCDCHWEGAKCCTPSTKLTKGSDQIQIQFKFEGEVRIETSNSINTCDSEFMLTEFISNVVFFPQKMVYLVWWNTSQDLNKIIITVELLGNSHDEFTDRSSLWSLKNQW